MTRHSSFEGSPHDIPLDIGFVGAISSCTREVQQWLARSNTEAMDFLHMHDHELV